MSILNKNFEKLKFRHVHLDFHTSEHIPDVGSQFNEQQFEDALNKGHVNSITLFAVCHHGWAYYDSKTTPRHPTLKTNLLERMLAVCKKLDIKTYIYITVGWNDRIGREHPEWIVTDKDGKLLNLPEIMPESPDDARSWGWPRICLNTPYLDYLAKTTSEVMDKFNPAGIFYDITGELPCYCEACRKEMKNKNIDIKNDAQVVELARTVYRKSIQCLSDIIWSYNPEATVYHNSRNKKGRDDLYKYFSHYEAESLPSGFWGFNHFPPVANYFLNQGFDVSGMTGKFHTIWGDFGGFKSAFGLQYECARILSFGAKCSIGDQMPPNGRMSMDTYSLIGSAYEYVEQIEKFYASTKNVADIAVLCGSAVMKDEYADHPETFAFTALLEMHYLCDMIDADMDFSKYKILVLPDNVPVNDSLKVKLDKYLAAGGYILMSGKSGLTPDGKIFNLDAGILFRGKSEWDVDYTLAGSLLDKDMPREEGFVNYSSAYMVEVEDAEVLATVYQPYFNRTYKHFCSHRHTPSSGIDASYPAVTKKNNIIYMAHDIFSLYGENGVPLYRALIRNCIELMLENAHPKVRTNLPSCGTVTLLERESPGEYILNLLYAVPIKRGNVQLVEDMIVLYNVEVILDRSLSPASVTRISNQQPLPYETLPDGNTRLIIPQLNMHEALLVKVKKQ
jgi:Hypothetical glycosyl hydrolase 6/Beta-galactosidase trimerisation domain